MITQNQSLSISFYISALAIEADGMGYTWSEFRQAQRYVQDFQESLRNDEICEEYRRRQMAVDAETERVRNIPLIDPRSYPCVICYGGAGCAVCRETQAILPIEDTEERDSELPEWVY